MPQTITTATDDYQYTHWNNQTNTGTYTPGMYYTGGGIYAPIHTPQSTEGIDKYKLMDLLGDIDVEVFLLGLIRQRLIVDNDFREFLRVNMVDFAEYSMTFHRVIKEEITSALTEPVNARTMLHSIVRLKENGDCDDLFNDFLTPIHRPKKADELARSVKV